MVIYILSSYIMKINIGLKLRTIFQKMMISYLLWMVKLKKFFSDFNKIIDNSFKSKNKSIILLKAF